MNSEKYIGLDVHQATIVVAVMDSTGKLVMESILETEATTISFSLRSAPFAIGRSASSELWSNFSSQCWRRWAAFASQRTRGKMCHERKKSLLSRGT